MLQTTITNLNLILLVTGYITDVGRFPPLHIRFKGPDANSRYTARGKVGTDVGPVGGESVTRKAVRGAVGNMIRTTL